MDEVRLGSRTLQPRRQLIANGQRVALGRRALDIVSVLAEARGGIVTKDELLDAVWPGVTVEENALQVHIVALRKALGPEAERLQTIRGVGYQLALDTVPHVAHASDQSESTATVPTVQGISIVVLPFANLSADPEQDYFAEGITEDIVTDLSKVSALKVVSRDSVGPSTGPVDSRDMARQLGATHLLEGSVRRSGKRVRVTAQLIEGAGGGHVWAERYDRDLSDIFEIQDELSAAIVDALKVTLLPQEKREIAARGTRNVEAYDYYLRARALRANMILEEIPLSLAAYRKAIELDPNFALAWAGLASSLFQNRAHFPGDKTITDEEINRAIDRACELAPDSPDVVACRSHRAVYERDWDEAAECIRQFRRIGDDNWSICSHLLLILGKAREAALQQEKVRRADPLSVGAAWALQFHLACAGGFEEAEAEFRRDMVLPGALRAMQWEALKRSLAKGDTQAAKSIFLEYFAAGGQFTPFAPQLAKALDNPPRASAVLRKELSDPASQDQLSRSRVADCAVLIGDTDLAFEAMRSAFVDARGVMMIEMWHPIFARMRPDPRFKQMLIDLGLIDYWRRTGDWGDFVRPLGQTDFEFIS